MEVPRFWREAPTNISFTGREKEMENSQVKVFKFPGGEIPLVGDMATIRERFVRRGFGAAETDEILFRLFNAVAAEAPISSGEIFESFLELVGSEVGK